MFLVNYEPRPNAIELAHSLGFVAAADYWREDRAYGFTIDEIEYIEAETERMHGLCVQAMQHMLRTPDILRRLKIPETHWEWLRKSFLRGDHSLYGRFDFRYVDNTLKLYEYNADTPTALWEAAVFQWLWMEAVFAKGEVDQFNSLEDKLTAAFRTLGPPGARVHFACLQDHAEDAATTGYLADRANAAGLRATTMDVADFGTEPGDHAKALWNVDTKERIHIAFKLYPWEWILR